MSKSLGDEILELVSRYPGVDAAAITGVLSASGARRADAAGAIAHLVTRGLIEVDGEFHVFPGGDK